MAVCKTSSKKAFKKFSNSRLLGRFGFHSGKSFIRKGDFGVQKASLHFPSFYSSKARWLSKTDFRSFSSKSLSIYPNFLSSLSENFEGISSPRFLLGQDRPEKRLSPCSRKQGISGLSGVSMEKQDLQVLSSSLWPVQRTSHFPGSLKLSCQASERKRYSLSGLSRRLCDLGPFSRILSKECLRTSKDSEKTWISNECRKVLSGSQSRDGLVGCNLGLKEPESEASARENSKDCKSSKTFSNHNLFVKKGLGDFLRKSGFCRSDFSRTKPSEKTSRPFPYKIFPRSNRDSSNSSCNSFGPELVDNSVKSRPLVLFSGENSVALDLDRRLRKRLGGSQPRWGHGLWNLGEKLQGTPYESFGAKGSSFLSSELSGSGRLCDPGVLRQRHHSPSLEKTGLFQVSVGDGGCGGNNVPVQQEESSNLSPQSSGKTQCTGGCLVEARSHARRMGGSSCRQEEDPPPISRSGGGLDGNPLQQSPPKLCLPLPSSEGSGIRCLVSRLEQVEENFSFSPAFSSQQGPSDPKGFQRDDDPHSEKSSSPFPSLQSENIEAPLQLEPSSPPISERSLGGGWKGKILSMDRFHFLRSCLLPKFGEELSDRILKGKRDSTWKQQNIAWKAFQKFLSLDFSESLTPALLLKFCLWLRDEKNLETSTICNYKAAVGFPLNVCFGLNFSTWEFKELKNALFLEKPRIPPRTPPWDISKVLELLSSDKYSSFPPDKFLQLKKSLFLVALACGNRVSELSATMRNGLELMNSLEEVILPVRPGFLFKNQRHGRTPPNIRIVPLAANSTVLCPVKNLFSYLSLSRITKGPLFRNSNSGKPLLKSSVSKLLCEVIEEADPGKFPKAHDLRRVATSLAWTRGLDPSEIAQRAFWRSSSIFIDRYLSSKSNVVGVALNTC